jgi:excisionase family DNA binding protein
MAICVVKDAQQGSFVVAEGRLLYRPGEAAEALGVSRARLYELLARGEIASVKIGASRRVPAVDLEDYVMRLRSQQVANAGEAAAGERAAA